MLNSFENFLVMLATVIAAVGFLYVVHRSWPSELRQPHNDLIGWHVSVLGSTYAVIIGFMLFAVWTNFETADHNAEAEANSVVSLARSSLSLPAGQSQKVILLADRYVETVLTKEWPAMQRAELSPASHLLIQQLWSTLEATELRTARQQSGFDHSLTELIRMTEYRRLRELQVNAYLPNILWVVLVLGATLTIMSACLFGTSHFRVHLVQVIMLALMISSVLVAIADINRPFQGSLHVEPVGFERARATLAGML